MEDVMTLASRLHRPRILVQTARHGLSEYRRARHLRRVLQSDVLPRPAEAIMRLLEIEGHANEQRLQERAEYSIANHIEVLVALMSETATLQAFQRSKARSAAQLSVVT